MADAGRVVMDGDAWADEVLRGMMAGFDSPGGRRLAKEIEDALARSLRDHRRRGLRNDGTDQIALKPSTLKNRKGGGPPLAPNVDASRVVRFLRTKVNISTNRIEIVASYPEDFARILRIQAAGNPPLAGPRPTAGVPKAARAEIAAKVASRWWRKDGLP